MDRGPTAPLASDDADGGVFVNSMPNAPLLAGANAALSLLVMVVALMAGYEADDDVTVVVG
jgi:hypothetical protein